MFALNFELKYTDRASSTLINLRAQAQTQTSKNSKQKGLYKQIHKTLKLLSNNPRHPGLQTHEFTSLEHPYNQRGKVFEAYAQNNTPGAYRVFWCYGPQGKEITIIAITPHP